MPRVNHEILKWARETAGLDLDEACQKLALQRARGMSARARLEALESGESDPSRALLGKMAKQYRRPLLVFYLPAPPRRVDRGEDLRSLPADHSDTEEALLDVLVRDVRARQSMIRSLMEEEDEATPVPLVAAGTPRDGAQAIALRISEALGFDLAEFRAAAIPDEAFASLRLAAESAGIFVLLIGDLGSHHTGLSVETFRGISLADPFAPIVIINDRDARSAWSFTLLHELTHIYLGQTAISGPWSEINIEQLCNDVASQVLLPDAELQALRIPDSLDLAWLQVHVQEFARARNLSGTMVAYRLHRRSAISKAQWYQLRARFRDLWIQGARERRSRNREAKSRPDYYVVRRHRVGSHLVEFVARMLLSGAVTTCKAGRILGVKPSNVYSLVDPI